MMARRVLPDSIEAKFCLEKYESAPKTGKDQEMTQFLESVSTQAGTKEIVDSPNTDESLVQLEFGYSHRRHRGFNDNSLSKVRNIFNTAAITAGKGRIELGGKESADVEDTEKSGRKLSSKMAKIKKIFGKDDKDATPSLTTSTGKVLAMLKSPNALPVPIPKLPELLQMVQSVSNANLQRDITPQLPSDKGNGNDHGKDGFSKDILEDGKSDFVEKPTAEYSSAEDTNRRKVAISDTSGGSNNTVIVHRPIHHEAQQESQLPDVPPHRDPVYPPKQAKDKFKDLSKKPLYNEQGFLCGGSDGEDSHTTRAPTASRRVPSPGPQFEGGGLNTSAGEEAEESADREPKHARSGENVLDSLAVAHYTPSIQQFLAQPKKAARDYERVIQLVEAQQEAKARRRAEETAKEKGNAEGNQGSGFGGEISSVPSFQELKRKEAEDGKGLEQLRKDKQLGIRVWLDAPQSDPGSESEDSPRQVQGPRQCGAKLESKDRKTASPPSSRDRQRMYNPFGLVLSASSSGSKEVDVLSTIEEDDLETEIKPQFPKIYQTSPTRPFELTPSGTEYPLLHNGSEATASPQSGTVEPASSPFDREPRDHLQNSLQPIEKPSPPSTPKAQTARGQRTAAEEIELIKKHIEDACNGKCEYNDYEAPSDITVGLSPNTLQGMYPPPLHIIKNPQKKRQGDAYPPTTAYEGPRGPRPLPVAPRHAHPQQRELPELPQSSHRNATNATNASARDERIRNVSDSFPSAEQGRIIEDMGRVMWETQERMDGLEERVEEMSEAIVRLRLLLAEIVGVDTTWYHNDQNAAPEA